MAKARTSDADKADLRVRLGPELKDAFDAVLRRKRISQVDAVTSLVGWFLELDDIYQSMILGQIEGNARVAELILQQIANQDLPPPKRRPGGASGTRRRTGAG